MKKQPKISVIIPLYIISERFFRDFQRFDKVKYSNFEIIVVADKKINLPKLKNVFVRFIKSGFRDSGPAEKRDVALKHAKGSICAFIDDDAYPDPNWLKEASKWFSHPEIVGVGGPGLTPKEDNYWQKIGGNIIESYLCSGGVQFRFKQTRVNFVYDYPAYNLLIRTNILKKVGGYGSTFYGGEDTFLCLKLIQHGFIVYDPKAVVYHHRRAFPLEHFKQIKSVAIHRGYFFIKFPKTSRTTIYILPTLLTLGLIASIILAIIYPEIFLLPLIICLILVLLLGTISTLKNEVKLFDSIISSIGIVFTHIIYGAFFVRGLLTKKLLR
jgi:glycosyltransferase involved in cell wall biosynthesis